MSPAYARYGIMILIVASLLAGIASAAPQYWALKPVKYDPASFGQYVDKTWITATNTGNWTATLPTPSADANILNDNWVASVPTPSADANILNDNWVATLPSSGSDANILTNDNWVATLPTSGSDPNIFL